MTLEHGLLMSDNLDVWYYLYMMKPNKYYQINLLVYTCDRSEIQFKNFSTFHIEYERTGSWFGGDIVG